MLPYVADPSMAPRLPSNFSSDIRFGDAAVFEVCTDEYGLRGSICGKRAVEPSVLVVGDSQALGWSMPFGHSVAALVARGRGQGLPGVARAMASGGADVESLRSWAEEYRERMPRKSSTRELNILVLNMGNDLDEMYYGRATGRMPELKALREWLTLNSYAMLDVALLKNQVSGAGDWHLPPGANPVAVALTEEERLDLAEATAEAVIRLSAALPAARQTMVLVLPTDYQISLGEFEKYRPFYPSSAQFDVWKRRLPAMARGLDDMERHITRSLARAGVQTVSPRALLAAQDPRHIFDRRSHHYTEAGHRVLAQVLLPAVQDGAVSTGAGSAHATQGRPLWTP